MKKKIEIMKIIVSFLLVVMATPGPKVKANSLRSSVRDLEYSSGGSGSDNNNLNDGMTYAKYPLADKDVEDKAVDFQHHRIVGGTRVPNSGIYSFFVSWGGQCGGSLIASNMVMTAAHCAGIETNKVVVGAHKFNLFMQPVGTETRTIVSKVMHPKYDDGTYEYDFMFLKLDEPVQSPNIHTININLDDPFVPDVGDNVQVIGMGALSEDGTTQDEYLQEVTVKVRSDDSCSDDYNGEINKDVMICAGQYGGGYDSCQGDSGGPMFTCNDDNTSCDLIGVVSWGYGCANADYPGVYAEVSAEVDWIKSVLCRHSYDKPNDCSTTNEDIEEEEEEMDNCDAAGSWCWFDSSACCSGDCFFVCQ